MNGPPLILIADDEQLVIDLACQALEPLDCIIETLADGSEVIDFIAQMRPQLIILDCSMPGLSGVEALWQIRASDDCFDIPVLMLTGRRAASDEAIARRAGANYYMRKPFEPADLLARVEFILAEVETRENCAFTPKETKVVSSASRRSINLV